MSKSLVALAALAALSLAVRSTAVQADTVSWIGTAPADFNTPADWSTSTTPTIPTTSDILIDGASSSVTYSGSGGDFRINSTLTVSNGASFKQTSGNWFKIGDQTGGPGCVTIASGATVDLTAAGNTWVGYGSTGTLTLNGGSMANSELNVGNSGSLGTVNLNTGTITASTGIVVGIQGTLTNSGGNLNGGGGTGASILVQDGGSFINNGGNTTFHSGGFLTSASSSVAISSGTVSSDATLPAAGSSNGSLSPTGNWTITGGVLDATANEFKPATGANVTMSAGTLKANLIRFENTGGMSFSGGLIDLYRGGPGVEPDGYTLSVADDTVDGYLNFTTGSTGVIDLIYSSVANDALQDFLTNGSVRYDGVTDAADFSVTSDGATGSLIQLIPSLQGGSPVPEPASLALLAVGGMALLRKRRGR